jgi:hypothetical protein
VINGKSDLRDTERVRHAQSISRIYQNIANRYTPMVIARYNGHELFE